MDELARRGVPFLPPREEWRTLALLGFVVMFHPDFMQAAGFAVLAAALVALGIYRYRHLAAARQPAAVGVAGQS